MSKEFEITPDERAILKRCLEGDKLPNGKPYRTAVGPMVKKHWLVDDGAHLVMSDLGRTIARQLGISAESRGKADG